MSSTISPGLRAALDEVFAIDSRPGTVVSWDRVARLAEATDDADRVIVEYAYRFILEVEKVVAGYEAEIARIAVSLGAEIIEVDPANKPEGLKDVTTRGWYRSEPTPRLFFPAGQPTYQRLDTARKIAESLRVTA